MEQIRGNSGGGGSIQSDETTVVRDLQLDALPEECISKVISHTSPRDACVVASVSKTVKSAAQSDLVWEMFLPSEYSSLVTQSMNCSSKKEIYLSLADDSFLIDDGKKSFWLEKSSGKKCYMLSALDLTITWGDSPAYWQWISLPQSKFEKVAELRNVCWLEICGKISCRILSKETHYSVYAVIKRAGNRSYGFDHAPVEAGVGFVGKEATKKSVFLESGAVAGTFRARRPRIRSPTEKTEVEEGQSESGKNREEPKERGDGWREVELGKFYINNGDCDDEIEITIMETKMGHWKSGLIIQGIEIRPQTRT